MEKLKNYLLTKSQTNSLSILICQSGRKGCDELVLSNGKRDIGVGWWGKLFCKIKKVALNPVVSSVDTLQPNFDPVCDFQEGFY